MTDTVKSRKLSHEILALIALSAGISLVLFLLLSNLAVGLAERYCFQNDIPMTEFDWMAVDRWIFGISAVLSCVSFSVLFLFLLRDRIDYIRKITAGIDRLHQPESSVSIPLEGNNELTALAASINEMSRTRQRLQEKERALAAEKEQLIRSLSHDIRTPLTAILSYSDFLAGRDEITPADRDAYLATIRKKAEQIRDLTAVLLDGSRREPVYFEDGKLLMEQLTAEFTEALEETFQLQLDLSGCPAFGGHFDVQELRRVFDNLSSNIQKYADPDKPVTLRIGFENGTLRLFQSNAVLPRKPEPDSYGIGISSIRRIAQFYGGSVVTQEQEGVFSIFIEFRIL